MALWTPVYITDGSLDLWFDATTGVVTSGSNVTSWTDLVNGVSATLLHGSTAPTYTASLLNGLPGITCAAGGGLGNTSTSFGNLNAHDASALLVILITGSGYQTIYGAYVSGGGEPTFAFDPGSPAPIAIFSAGVNDTQSTQTLAQNTAAIAEWVAPAISGGSWTGVQPYINGTAGAVIPAMTIGAFTQTGIEIFCDVNTGTSGNVHEVVVFNLAVGTTNRQLTEGYLAWKWGLQAGLPAGHPYKSAAPQAPVAPSSPSNPFINVWISK